MLPVSLRLGSLVSILIYALIATIVLARAETITYGIPSSRFGIAIWVVAAYFLVAIALNLASKSTSERAVMPIVSAVLCVLCIVVALR